MLYSPDSPSFFLAPHAGVTRDVLGNIFGTTYEGGRSGFGLVFKLEKNGKEIVLHSFIGAADGEYPEAGLVQDAAGTLYGTTYQGGTSNFGTAFKLTKAGKKIVLHNFAGGSEGAYPYAGLVSDGVGNLYGTTYQGGPLNRGTVFKIDTAGRLTVLHSFEGGTDGANPYAGLILDKAGNLYGTTEYGGASGQGTVFKIGP